MPEGADGLRAGADRGRAWIDLSLTTRGASGTGITKLLQALAEAGLQLRDVHTSQSSLEEIFVDLVQEDAA